MRILKFLIAAGLLVATSARSEAVGPGAARLGGEITSVVLRAVDDTGATPATISMGLLARELYRQALVLVLWDELGLPVRDEQMGEVAPVDSGAAVLELTWQCVPGESVSVSIVRVDGGEKQPVWSGGRPLPKEPQVDYVALVTAAEEMAREEWAPALRKAGLAGEPNRLVGEGPPHAETARLLAELSPLAQFSAVRRLHAETRSEGESSDRINALVRAYAQLGLHTDFFRVPLDPFFRARSLIYAQRRIAREPNAAEPLRLRAFALALAGAHRSAETDLQAADAIEKPNAKPAWVGLVSALVRFEEAAGDDGAMASLLRFLVIRDSRAIRLLEERGLAILSKHPECYLVYETLHQADVGLGVLHKTTLAGPLVFERSLPKRLAEMPGLPAAATKGRPEEVTKALSEAATSDRAPGLSWAVLARIVREIRFAQAYDRVYFMDRIWGVPFDEYLEEARPLIAEHPYAAYLESLRLQDAGDKAGHDAAIRSIPIDLTGVSLNADTVVRNRRALGEVESIKRAVSNGDSTDRGLGKVVLVVADRGKPAVARQRLDVSPHSPTPVAQLVEFDWAASEPKAEEWERVHAHHPRVLAALARRYNDLGRWEDAERCLRKYIGLSPDGWAYRMLAGTFRARGDMSGWMASLEEYLKAEETGLGHAQARVEIATELMSRGRFREAEPYAAAAAETGAEWAMRSASNCYERLEDWERSENWVRRIAERYPASSLEWYFWCRRTGRGDEAAAKKLAERFVAALPKPIPAEFVRAVASFHELTGRPDLAKGVYFPQGFATRKLADMLSCALLMGRPEESERRAGLVERVARSETPMAPLAALYVPDADIKAALAEIDRTRAEMPQNERALASYYVGRALQERGLHEQARTYLEEAAGSVSADWLTRTIAAVALREKGNASRPDRPD